MMIKPIARFREIAELSSRFDFFIIDLWGVMHDGTTPYPGAIETLATLRKQNKKIVFLSNAPRRASKVIENMTMLGFARGLYDDIFTSGEAGYRWLTKWQSLGSRYYYIGPEKDADILSGLYYERVYDPKNADFAIITGFNEFGDPFESKKPETDKCLENSLPLICINPDRIFVRQNGDMMLCAGLVADYYMKNKGKVFHFGKPYKDVYDYCIEALGNPAPSLIAAIGDSLHTDVLGANNIGAYSVLIPGGVLGEGLNIKHGELPDMEKLYSLCEKEKTFPQAILPAFR